MPTRARTLSLLLLCPLALTFACGDEGKDDSGPDASCDPVANAGEDLSLSFGETATLDGCPPVPGL